MTKKRSQVRLQQFEWKTAKWLEHENKIGKRKSHSNWISKLPGGTQQWDTKGTPSGRGGAEQFQHLEGWGKRTASLRPAWFHSVFQASLSYILRPYLENKNKGADCGGPCL
jgi:hypothetical protein